MGLIPDETVEEYPLPWEVTDIDGKDITEGAASLVPAGGVKDLLSGRDYLKAESGFVVGDGKNLYGVRVREDVDSLLEDELEGEITVHADCLGVCSPEKYEAIMEEEGFMGVVELVNSVEYNTVSGEVGICNGEEAARYVPGWGVVYPEESGRPLTDGSRTYVD